VVTTPTARQERVNSVDVLRGIALLGILAINILSFGMIPSAEENPTIAGGATGVDLYTWFLINVLFEGKMRAIFSMLFGAGLILITTRAEDRGDSASIADVWLRRNLWLLLFGCLHAYFIWSGDILYSYGLTGLFLYPFRKLRPAILVSLGLLALSTQAARTWSEVDSVKLTKAENDIAAEVEKTKLPMTDELKKAKESWQEHLKEHHPSKEEIEKERKRLLSGYSRIFLHRAADVAATQSSGYYHFILWDVAGMMFIGMGLMKARILTAEKSAGVYLAMMLGGYAIGLPLRAGVSWIIWKSNWDILTVTSTGLTYDLGRITTAIGHVGLILLICRRGWMEWLTRRLAAVGQMALTNYITHSLICTTLFYGYGFALYGSLWRHQLYYVMAAIWIFQIIFSPIWLKHFLFGPLEWAWRSLTYWKRQPMRVPKPPACSSDAPSEAAVESV